MSNLLEFLRTNFLHVAPILAAGAVACAIILERVRALVWAYPMKNQSGFFEKLRDLVMSDRLTEALSLCERYGNKPVAKITKDALLRAHQPESLIQDSLELSVGEWSNHASSRTPFLATIANVSTLLGLFGTIVGLIHSFEAVGTASPQQKAALLAAGISTAMNATLLGLGVAIPCMIAFSYLTNRTNHLTAEFEQAALRILTLIKQRSYSAEVEPYQPEGKGRAA